MPTKREDEYVKSSIAYSNYGATGYSWYDKFCGMYWNHSRKEWQKKRTKDCIFKSKALAHEDEVYFFDSDDIRLDFFCDLALAA